MLLVVTRSLGQTSYTIESKVVETVVVLITPAFLQVMVLISHFLHFFLVESVDVVVYEGYCTSYNVIFCMFFVSRFCKSHFTGKIHTKARARAERASIQSCWHQILLEKVFVVTVKNFGRCKYGKDKGIVVIMNGAVRHPHKPVEICLANSKQVNRLFSKI
jgi:hypothetical protein